MENIDINTTPAMPAPPGDVNNLVNSYSQQTGLVVAAAICLTLTTAFVVIRTFTKTYVMRAVRVEDCRSDSWLAAELY